MIKMLFSIFSSSSGVTAAPSLKRRASRTLDSLKDPSASLSFCMVADNQSAESSSQRYTTNLFLQGAKDTHRQSRVINGLEKTSTQADWTLLRFIISFRSQYWPRVFQPTIHSICLKKLWCPNYFDLPLE